jgi:hypothetical protein
VWTNASDENLKENFKTLDGNEILNKISELKITQWNYKNENAETTHIGPTAQNFYSLFKTGGNDKTISTIDPSGVALIGIQQLIKENTEMKARIDVLEKEIQELRTIIKQ